jgi:ribonucleoside-triphosphate reductase
MKVIKRNDSEQDFDLNKIRRAIRLANESLEEPLRMNDEQFEKVINTVVKRLDGFTNVSTESIDDFVEMALTRHNRYNVLKAYIKRREEKKQTKKFTENEEKVLSLLSGNSELRGDNANKNIDDNGTMRDYFAGILSKSLTNKLLPKDVLELHKRGLGHFHDADYQINKMHNCDLINVEDMFKNGFQMQSTKIEPNENTPFRTACNLLAQVNLIISGRQYGGQTVSWSHLLPFIGYSRNNIRKSIIERYSNEEPSIKKYRRLLNSIGIKTGLYNTDKINKEVEELLRKEIYEGVKTYQYQILCHSSSNGQTPFVSNNLCLREAQTQQELDDFVMLIEEIFKRRIKGVKDASGHYISPLFPKLLYWTCDGLNINDSDPYYELTKLAAKCVSTRMQPDIVSERETRKVKKGQIIPSMGCRSLLAPIWEMRTYPASKEFYWVEGASLLDDYGISEIADTTFPEIAYPYGTFVDKKSFENIPNGKYKFGKYRINFRGNTGWLIAKDNETVTIIEPKVYGRWNNGVFTINLPYIGLEALEAEPDNQEKRIEKFYSILNERLEICRKALVFRYKQCASIKGKNSSILWQYGALARIGAEDTVGGLMKKYPQRASMSLGYAGLFETCQALIGKSNTTDEGRKLSKEILAYLNKRCNEWKKVGDYIGDEADIYTQECPTEVWDELQQDSKHCILIGNKIYTTQDITLNDNSTYIVYIEKTEEGCFYKLTDKDNFAHINYSIYGTPIESLTLKMALANRRDFGLIDKITDKDYIVNSYHVDPRETIDAFKKIEIEGEYLALSSGGAVSYVETPDLTNNTEAIETLIKHMDKHIVYAEINRSLGTCYECGYEGVIPLTKTDDGKFKFTCPQCGNTDDAKMHVVCRLCGYIGTVNAGNTNVGRLDDIYSRTLHTDCYDEECTCCSKSKE